MISGFSSADSDQVSSLSPRKRTGWTLVTVLLSVLMVAASIRLTGTRQVFDRLRDVDVRWLGAAFAVAVVQLGLLGLRWSKIAGELGLDLGWWRATIEYALSVLANQVLPTGLIGDGVRGMRHARASKRGVWPAFEALVLDRASGQLALWFLVLVGTPLSIRAGVLGSSMLWSALVLGAIALGVWWLVFHLPVFAPHIERLRPSLRRAVALLFSRRSVVHFPISLLLVGCSTLQLWIAARALGVSLPCLELCWLAPLILIAAALPGFSGGWGIRESASALLFASAGFQSSTGVAVSLVFGVFALICALPGILVLLYEGGFALRRAAEPARDPDGGEPQAVALLCATVMAPVLALPALPTAFGVLSLMVLVVRSRGAWTPRGTFGLANTITTLRLFMTPVLVLVPAQWPGSVVALTALTILGLDFVDGWLARRSGAHGPFGARYDMEVDAVFVLSLSAALWSRGVAGTWVLLAGLWRYLFVVIPLLVPSRGGEAPRSLIYRSAYAVMVLCFLVSLLLPPGYGQWTAAFGTFVLSASFLRSFWYRYSPPTLGATP